MFWRRKPFSEVRGDTKDQGGQILWPRNGIQNGTVKYMIKLNFGTVIVYVGKVKKNQQKKENIRKHPEIGLPYVLFLTGIILSPSPAVFPNVLNAYGPSKALFPVYGLKADPSMTWRSLRARATFSSYPRNVTEYTAFLYSIWLNAYYSPLCERLSLSQLW